MASIVRMPEVLANASEAIVSTWLVQKGQTVTVGVPLAEVETEKAVIEYAAEIAGAGLDLLVDEGKSVSVGEAIAVIGEPGESLEPPAADPTSAAAPPPAAAPQPPSAPQPASASAAPSANGHGRLFASPLVRRLARDRGLDLTAVTGTGPSGRIVRRDLEALPAPAPIPVPADANPPATNRSAANPPATNPPATTPPAAPLPLSSPQDRGFEDVPVTGMRRAIARRLTESKATVPHFYLAG